MSNVENEFNGLKSIAVVTIKELSNTLLFHNSSLANVTALTPQFDAIFNKIVESLQNITEHK